MKTAPGAAAVGMPTCAEGSRAILTWLLGSVKCDFFNAATSRTLSFNKLKKKKSPPSLIPLPLPYAHSHTPAFAAATGPAWTACSSCLAPRVTIHSTLHASFLLGIYGI